MSANRNRLTSAIRAIALTPEERRALLGEGKNKGGKASSAGVGTSEAEESRLCCDGSTASNANPGTGERDPGADGAGQDGLDSSDPANLSSGDGTLSGITDCATGEPICFDGDGFIPPEGWEEPGEPPIDPTFEEGIYYLVRDGDGGESYYQTCAPALSAFESILAGCGINSTSASCSPYQGVAITGGGDCGGATFIKKGCSADYNAICDEPPPLADAWPSDGCTNLAIKGGKIVGSKYDPENDGSYSAPRDSIDLCDGSGNQISLAPSASGGWKTIDAINGGDGYLYDSSGKQIARISEAEYSDPAV